MGKPPREEVPRGEALLGLLLHLKDKLEILRRLAGGKRSFSEPAGSLGSARTSLSYYLGVTAR